MEDDVILWKHRLRMSFKNLRRRSSALTTCPVVLNMKRKYGNKKDAEVQPPNKVQKDIWGVANFPPERKKTPLRYWNIQKRLSVKRA